MHSMPHTRSVGIAADRGDVGALLDIAGAEVAGGGFVLLRGHTGTLRFVVALRETRGGGEGLKGGKYWFVRVGWERNGGGGGRF